MPHKLLLADDSVTIQRVIELTFADEDVDVVAVGDGQQAILRAQADPPDIVLADVGMPERDGYEVASFIKGTPALAHIPVLLLTGAFEPIDEARARAAGCDGVLVKPFEPQLVISRVKDLISGRRPAFDSAAVPAPAAVPGSADEYFDRLGTLAEELSGWNPDAITERPAEPRPEGPLRVVPNEAVSPEPQAPADAPRTLQPQVEGAAQQASVEPAAASSAFTPAAAMQARLPTLAGAFAALLAAERGQPARSFDLPADIDDRTIDRLAQRVAERLGDRDIRAIVLEVAERLVAEEIDRIKSHAR